MSMKLTKLPFFVLLTWLCWFGFANAGPSKSFKQWDVYCSDVLDCGFYNWVESEVINSLEYLRAGKANAPVEIRIFTAKPLKENAKLNFSIPGVLDGFSVAFKDGVVTDGYTLFSDPKIESELLPAMRMGVNMIVSVDTQEQSAATEFSLSGVSAAMLYLDDVQNRLNKTDALVEKGDGAATGVKSRVSELKSADDLPPAVASAWKNHPDQCSEDFGGGDLISRLGGIVINWDEEKTIKHYVIPCGGPGAYNLIYAAFLFDESENTARSLQFPTMSDRGPTLYSTIINMSWDERNSQLSSFAKGRGLGDCGTASKWEWDGAGAYGNLILVEERAKDDCDGVYDDWPLVWPIK